MFKRAFNEPKGPRGVSTRHALAVSDAVLVLKLLRAGVQASSFDSVSGVTVFSEAAA
jgi:hypothetical protein